MGLSQRKKTNRKFNGSKMVINNVGTPSTLVPKNQFSETNQYPELNPGTDNFVPCTFEEGLYNPEFIYQQTGFVNVCLDQNPFYGKNKLILGRNIGTSVVDSGTGELLYNDSSLSAVTSVIQLPLNQYLWSGNSNRFLRKLNSDLSFDNSFILGFKGTPALSKSIIKLTPDNKILVYIKSNATPFKINYTANTPTYSQQIYKLNMDGSINSNFSNQTDTQINSNTQFYPTNSVVNNIEIVPNPNNSSSYQIFIVGKFEEYQGTSRINFYELNQIGIVNDELHSPFTDINQQLTSIKYVGNSKLLIGGYFQDIEGYSYLLRFNTDTLDAAGEVDTTFINSNIPGPVTSIDLDINGKIIVSYNNQNVGTVQTYVRLNSDGSIDETFNIQNFVTDLSRLNTTNFIYKSNNGGYFLRGELNDFENGNSVPSFIKLKGC